MQQQLTFAPVVPHRFERVHTRAFAPLVVVGRLRTRLMLRLTPLLSLSLVPDARSFRLARVDERILVRHGTRYKFVAVDGDGGS